MVKEVFLKAHPMTVSFTTVSHEALGVPLVDIHAGETSGLSQTVHATDAEYGNHHSEDADAAGTEGVSGTQPLSLLSAARKFLYIKTYGCQMNVYDSQRMQEAMAPLGFAVVDDPAQADVAILNGCQIREQAEDKLFSDLGRLRVARQQRHKQNQELIIVVAGCVGQALGGQVLKKAPYVDVVVGPQTYHTLPETITRILRNKAAQHLADQAADQAQAIQDSPKTMPLLSETVQNSAHTVSKIKQPNPIAHLALGFPKMEKFDELPAARGLVGPSAFLSIQEGCDKFCRYCVVPYTRGPEYSRPMQDVVNEAAQLVNQGAREITLLGQNVNAYRHQATGGDVWTLGTLLTHLAATFPDVARWRYTTSHPRDVDETLVQAHHNVSTVMPFVHLPVQSGSDRVLARMNRQYTAALYYRVIDQLRQAHPHMAFSSDFIVGYPGETDEDFAQTLTLVENVKFAQAFSFAYSPRPGTPAAMAVQIPDEVKKQRLHTLQALLTQQRLCFNRSFSGQTVSVLVEPLYPSRPGKKVAVHGQESRQPMPYQDHPDWVRCIGKTPFMQTVHFMAPKEQTPQTGQLVTVRVSAALTNSLLGTFTPAA